VSRSALGARAHAQKGRRRYHGRLSHYRSARRPVRTSGECGHRNFYDVGGEARCHGRNTIRSRCLQAEATNASTTPPVMDAENDNTQSAANDRPPGADLIATRTEHRRTRQARIQFSPRCPSLGNAFHLWRICDGRSSLKKLAHPRWSGPWRHGMPNRITAWLGRQPTGLRHRHAVASALLRNSSQRKRARSRGSRRRPGGGTQPGAGRPIRICVPGECGYRPH